MSFLRIAVLAIVVVASPLVAIYGPNATAATGIVRINAGGPAQTVGGTQWLGCTAVSQCGGYVNGGNAYAQQPAPTVTGFESTTNQAIHRTEWTGGEKSGIAAGKVAFTFNVPVTADNDYKVRLHFTELNKTAANLRLFDVNIDGASKLTNFDVFAQAGGRYKTIVREFTVHNTDGRLDVQFFTRKENAKVDAIEIIPVGGVTTTSTSTTATTAAPAPLKWTAIASTPYARAEASGGIINGKLYAFGGFGTSSWEIGLKTSAVYDLATNKWATNLPPVPYALTHSARVIDGNSFILVGGVSEVSGVEVFAIDDVIRYDTTTNSWSTLPSLPEARGAGAASIVGRNLHFFGGVDFYKHEQNDHWVLNLDDLGAGWTDAAPTPHHRSHFAAVTYGTDVYSIAGETGWDETSVYLADCYKYNTLTDTWSPIASMPVGISHIDQVTEVYNNKIWVFGGQTKFPNKVKTIYVYDFATNKWSTSASTLPSERFAGTLGITGNTVYHTFGTITSTAAWKTTLPN